MKTINLIIIMFTVLFVSQTMALSIKESEINYSAYENRSCEELYRDISALEHNTLNYDSPLYNRRNNDMATVASTVFTPAVFFVGFSNAMNFKSEYEASKNNQELNYLRNRMGEMRCFIK